MTPYEQLLEDLDESLDAEGMLPLYTFSWWLRGQEQGLDEPAIDELCRRAYDEVRRRYELRLEWLDGPQSDPEDGRPAEPGVELDFDIDPQGEVTGPILALIPIEP